MDECKTIENLKKKKTLENNPVKRFECTTKLINPGSKTHLSLKTF